MIALQKISIKIAIALAGIFLLASCQKEELATIETLDLEAKANAARTQTVMQIINNDATFKFFKHAATHAGMIGELNSLNNITVFAPDVSAFDCEFGVNGISDLPRANRECVHKMVRYHIIPDANIFNIGDFSDDMTMELKTVPLQLWDESAGMMKTVSFSLIKGIERTTLAGETVKFWLAVSGENPDNPPPGWVTIYKVVFADKSGHLHQSIGNPIHASNGTIYGIDGVMHCHEPGQEDVPVH
jgi:uncharacterized surface protein with fasciclin (FAS1) repeats